MRRLPLRSPPRVRGKAVAIFRQLHHGRITPACAGKSHPHRSAQDRPRDHPRVCGEKPLQSSVNCTMEGSPPRMRGKGISRHGVTHNRGITPAYAGKRDIPSRGNTQQGDHPRVCGEKTSKQRISSPASGSPPRMRGKGLRLCAVLRAGGITPAYAGKRIAG